jgi:murein DD-endopeptidase MepM/ murein hydrolase activator NlpD
VFDHFRIDVALGDPNGQPDKKHRYRLPFKKGKAYRLIQGFNGSFSHNTENARYALDFDLAVGDTIYAARGGVAVKVEENFTAGGAEDKYRDKDNHVLIYHSDGTLGAYAHLDHQGAFVAPGDRVEAGQPIGISGFTGYASVPHLHFVVRQTTRDGQVTVPIRFQGVRKLQEGTIIKRRK